MKTFFFFLLVLSACTHFEKDYTIKIVYTDGTTETIQVRHWQEPHLHNKGCVSVRSTQLRCGVRSFTFTNIK